MYWHVYHEELPYCIAKVFPKEGGTRNWHDVTLNSVFIRSNLDGHQDRCILTLPSSLRHWTWYGCGCFLHWRFNLEHNSVLARLWQLPPSIITLIDLPLIPTRVWKRLHLWSSFSEAWVVNTLETTSDGLGSCSHTWWSCSCISTSWCASASNCMASYSY